jgi:hypothetical protein
MRKVFHPKGISENARKKKCFVTKKKDDNEHYNNKFLDKIMANYKKFSIFFSTNKKTDENIKRKKVIIGKVKFIIRTCRISFMLDLLDAFCP